MSGLLRRIKRSRPADAGEPHQQGRAAEAEDATTTHATPPASADSSEATTQIVAPAGDATSGRASEGRTDEPAAEDPQTAAAGEPTPAPGQDVPARPRRRWRPFRRRARAIPPATAAPVLKADPSIPAGIDPAAAPMRPPAGRRGRLRRRLRYLRRARELMLRDLGGLLYEIHRTGGGKVEAHANVVGAKVQRIAGLDAEAHALETALSAPRAETVLFEPGIGGTCATCGELYGSDARFCAHCGTPIGQVPETRSTETQEVVSEPARRAVWRRAARPAAGGDEAAAGEQPAAGETGAAGAEAPAGDAAGREATGGEATGGDTARGETAGGDAAGAEAPAGDAAGREATGGEAAGGEAAGGEAARGETAGGDAAGREAAGGGAAGGDAAGREAAGGGEAARGGEAAPTDDPSEPAPGGATDAGGDEPHNPHASGRNGRPEDRKSPGLPSGDPSFSRERS
jgi:hypothetical protein